MIKRQPFIDLGYPVPKKEPPMLTANGLAWACYHLAKDVRDTRGKGSKVRLAEEYTLGQFPFRLLRARQGKKREPYYHRKRAYPPDIIEFPTLGLFLRETCLSGRVRYRWSRRPSDEDLAVLKLSIPRQYVKYLAS